MRPTPRNSQRFDRRGEPTRGTDASTSFRSLGSPVKIRGRR